MADYGYTFQPGSDRMDRPQQSGGGGAISPQEAIRILSFRVPKQPVAGFAPRALLPGAATQGSDASALNTIVRALMTAMSQNPTTAQPSMGGGGVASPGQQNLTFTGSGGIGSVLPPTWNAAPPPTFTPGGGTPQRDPVTTDLFGNDVSREGGSGTGERAVRPNVAETFSDWVPNENVLNGRTPLDYTMSRLRR